MVLTANNSSQQFEMNDIAFELKNSDSFLGAMSYFQKKIGHTDHCFTPDEIVFLVFADKRDSHLQQCSECFNKYNDLKEEYSSITVDDEDEIKQAIVENIQQW